MSKIRDFVFDQGIVGFVCTVLAAILCIVSVVVYALTGANEFNPEISALAIVVILLTAGVALLSLFLRFKEVRILAFLLSLASLICYGGSQANYLANILTAIDGSSASPSLILTFALLGGSFLLLLIGFIGLRERQNNTTITISERND